MNASNNGLQSEANRETKIYHAAVNESVIQNT